MNVHLYSFLHLLLLFFVCISISLRTNMNETALIDCKFLWRIIVFEFLFNFTIRKTNSIFSCQKCARKLHRRRREFRYTREPLLSVLGRKCPTCVSRAQVFTPHSFINIHMWLGAQSRPKMHTYNIQNKHTYIEMEMYTFINICIHIPTIHTNIYIQTSLHYGSPKSEYLMQLFQSFSEQVATDSK